MYFGWVDAGCHFCDPYAPKNLLRGEVCLVAHHISLLSESHVKTKGWLIDRSGPQDLKSSKKFSQVPVPWERARKTT